MLLVAYRSLLFRHYALLATSLAARLSTSCTPLTFRKRTRALVRLHSQIADNDLVDDLDKSDSFPKYASIVQKSATNLKPHARRESSHALLEGNVCCSAAMGPSRQPSRALVSPTPPRSKRQSSIPSLEATASLPPLIPPLNLPLSISRGGHSNTGSYAALRGEMDMRHLHSELLQARRPPMPAQSPLQLTRSPLTHFSSSYGGAPFSHS